ncbi:hypothetical protein EG68_08746 [Paragonimus skrjabini miyazakii]|uniref:FAD-dependent oxidoreductase domain-containing protein 1 n=1 Tax=Paragonimus skrjabini miyazakii TaxID=59628 RepID=A0A8S9YMU0_9TREM|nr:hypothetical protein EG68_08746 [Paragonimus skrjabini miyazakii]
MSRLLKPALFLGVCRGNAWNRTVTCSLHNRHFSNESKWNNFGPSDLRFREDQVPKQSDILIVGGGLIGWSVAFWMRWTTKFGVTVVERDPTYARSASVLGLGSIRQQFSEPENIQMSLFGSDFLRNIKDYLSVLDDSQLDIEFNPQGCLLLADSEQAGTMEQNFHLQTELGAKVELLSKEALKSRWPWLNVEDIELGCYGYENEGWFDPWLLLKALRAKCHMLGVNYVVGEVVDFEASQYLTEISFPDMPKRAPVIGRALREAVIALPDGSTSNITFNMVVNAAGPWAADLARLAEIGTTEQLAMPLPVEPRLRHVYVVRPKRTVLSPQSRRPPEPTVEPEPLQLPGLDTPFIVDPKRLFVERRGLSGEFIVYSDDPQWDSVLVTAPQQSCNFDADYALFKESIGQQLKHRIPTLASVDVTSAWAAVCDYNTVDQNLIIGHHPYHVNMFFCNGSSGHGSQHSIAIGRAISELIVYGHYKTIDLTRFSFDRFYLNEFIQEKNAF